MTPHPEDDPERAVVDYEAALSGHLADVEAFLALTARQAEVTASAAEAEALEAIVAERDTAMARLLDTAAGLAPLRRVVESLEPPWDSHPSWLAAASARERIRECLDLIVEHDRRTRASLEAARTRHQQDRQELEAANATLIAYRRTLGPNSRPAALLDHRG